MVKDVNTGGASSEPSYLTAVGGTLFFTARDETHGRELWKSEAIPPAAPPQGVPTLSRWGMIGMVAIFALVLVWIARRDWAAKARANR